VSAKVLFHVHVHLTIDVVCDLGLGTGGMVTKLAEAAAVSRLRAALTDHSLLNRVSTGSLLDGYADDDKNLDHYTCTFCGKTTPKYDWGPGWVRCPECGKLVPSVAETSEMTP